jgi:hypothetical protein
VAVLEITLPPLRGRVPPEGWRERGKSARHTRPLSRLGLRPSPPSPTEGGGRGAHAP